MDTESSMSGLAHVPANRLGFTLYDLERRRQFLGPLVKNLTTNPVQIRLLHKRRQPSIDHNFKHRAPPFPDRQRDQS